MNKPKSGEAKSKACFVIMPISDMDGYDSGHFSRVYEHLIKPACENAGYTPIRADEVASSNYIVIDILSKIVESELVLCDLSGRNPNVLYELGIRQAFNLPTVLIKDIKTNKIFDIQGLRYTEYNQALRIDSVQQQIADIEKSIRETEKAKGKDINSLVQLLGLKPATLPSQVELSNETSVVLSAINDLSKRMSSLEQTELLDNPFIIRAKRKAKASKIIPLDGGEFEINNSRISIGDTLYISGKELGQLADVTPDSIMIKKKNGELTAVSSHESKFNDIVPYPF